MSLYAIAASSLVSLRDEFPTGVSKSAPSLTLTWMCTDLCNSWMTLPCFHATFAWTERCICSCTICFLWESHARSKLSPKVGGRREEEEDDDDALRL